MKKWVFDIHKAMDHLDDALWTDTFKPWVIFYGVDEKILARYCWDGDFVEMPQGTSKVVIALYSKIDPETRVAVLDSTGVDFSDALQIFDVDGRDANVYRCPVCGALSVGTLLDKECPECLTKW